MTSAVLLALSVIVPSAEPRVVGYYTEWSVYARKFHVSDIPASRLTHVNYAFAKIEGGEVKLHDPYAAIDKFYPGDKWDAGYLRGNFRQLRLLKEKHPHLKVLLAIGGWTLSSPFSDAALTPASREKLARSAAELVVKYGLDGVDLDWEYPVSGGLASNKTRPEDRENYPLLCAAIRKELAARGKKEGKSYLLTVAAPAGPRVVKNFDLKKLAPEVDWLNLMAYDFHGGWSPRTHFNAPLAPIEADPEKDEEARRKLNVTAAVQAYLDAGVPPEKVVLGLPLYGRGWQGVKEGDGLFQKPAATLPRGTWEPGVYDYKDLAAHFVPKMKRHWSAEARAPWLHDATSGLMISYDDAESIKAKAALAREKRLGGVMMWELSCDDSKGTLLTAARKGLGLKK